MKNQGGFNLVELAIVMVIIGLLLGGVLKGQSLVVSAKIKRVNNDFNGITAAIYTYLDRYGSLPGDDTRATTRWPSADSIANGNGNGLIEGTWDNTGGTVETNVLWAQLRAASLISGTGTAFPTNAFDGIIGVQDAPIGMSGTAVCMSNMTGEIAEIVDISFDDGVRNAGLLQSIQTSAPAETAPADATYTGDETYSICKRI